uniref:Ribosomal protein S11 n=1 Tax=Porolithon onkodes TaxID=231751 RepID=A0A2Z2L3K1_9FLOR|nr:ribosomal protein S11 [Porolithon onkodes]ASB29833.1 ribosomal protein S11 [Porolithon onkodes]
MQLISGNSAILSILFTKNNIFCTFSNLEGKTLFATSVGSTKTKGLKKITSTTLFTLVKKLSYQVFKFEIAFLYLKVKGANKSKNDFFKLSKNIKVNIPLIQNQHRISYGGCKVSRVRKI